MNGFELLFLTGVVVTLLALTAMLAEALGDMCFAVTGAARQGNRLAVDVRISNRARRVTEGEGDLRGARLWADGLQQEPIAGTGTGAVPLSVRLAPGASADSVQMFSWPGRARELGLVLDHGFTPGWFVIGECPLWHRPAVMLLGGIQQER